MTLSPWFPKRDIKRIENNQTIITLSKLYNIHTVSTRCNLKNYQLVKCIIGWSMRENALRNRNFLFLFLISVRGTQMHPCTLDLGRLKPWSVGKHSRLMFRSGVEQDNDDENNYRASGKTKLILIGLERNNFKTHGVRYGVL